MSQIKDALLKAMSKNIPLHLVGQRALEMATMTDEHAAEYLAKATEHALKRNVAPKGRPLS